MGINQFNRSNPMVILMRRSNDEFTSVAVNTIKKGILRFLAQLVLQVILFVCIVYKYAITRSNPSADNVLPVILIAGVFLLILIGYNFIATMNVSKNRKMQKINELIYGSTLEVADANNEDILKIINDLQYMTGRLDMARNLTSVYSSVIIFNQVILFIFILRL